MPSARPILFTGPMVRALIDGTKTQTRRLIKRPTDHFHASCVTPKWQDDRFWWFDDRGQLWRELRCPYGVPGDLLWVRETWHLVHVGGGRGGGLVPFNSYELGYGASHYLDARHFTVEGDNDPHLRFASDAPRPSIHMPRWASRLTLRLTGIRAQRLHDIGEADAIAEGAERLVMDDEGKFYQSDRGTHRCGYAGLWDHINGAGSWDSNPWVWALTFTVHQANVDTMLAEAAAPAMETA